MVVLAKPQSQAFIMLHHRAMNHTIVSHSEKPHGGDSRNLLHSFERNSNMFLCS